jgi:four helix bundle protein
VNTLQSAFESLTDACKHALMRDHNKFVAFHTADALAIAVYRTVHGFPPHERYGLAQQLRRAAVSIGANIVEGCARETAAEYARFLSIAYGSACEAQYEIGLAQRLGYLNDESSKELTKAAADTTRLLSRLLRKAQQFRENDR